MGLKWNYSENIPKEKVGPNYVTDWNDGPREFCKNYLHIVEDVRNAYLTMGSMELAAKALNHPLERVRCIIEDRELTC